MRLTMLIAESNELDVAIRPGGEEDARLAQWAERIKAATTGEKQQRESL